MYQLKAAPLRSGYTYVARNPFGANPKAYKAAGMPGHEGVDFFVPEGTPVYAADKGKVVQVVSNRSHKWYGNLVRIDHFSEEEGRGYQTLYAHLRTTVVKNLQEVEAGQLIGYSGNTGNSSGPHLHFTMKRKGASFRRETNFPLDVIDPTEYLHHVMSF